MNNESRIKLERAIVNLLISELAKDGFLPVAVDDGGELVKTPNAKKAINAVFAVNDSWLYFKKGSKQHGVMLVGGNGEDIISDWDFWRDDADGFNAAMDKFVDTLDMMLRSRATR